MASKKKGLLTSAPQRWKHLKPYWSRYYWKRERIAQKIDINDRLNNE